MEHETTINLLKNTPNQPNKYRAKDWVEVNDSAHGRVTPLVKLNLKLHC